MQLDRRSAASISTLSIQIRPIDAVMGAEVTGADLSQPLDDATLGTFKDALHRSQVAWDLPSARRLRPRPLVANLKPRALFRV
jgi:alpha-ketoglutarate-dependent taurine dioxygenase